MCSVIYLLWWIWWLIPYSSIFGRLYLPLAKGMSYRCYCKVLLFSCATRGKHRHPFREKHQINGICMFSLKSTAQSEFHPSSPSTCQETERELQIMIHDCNIATCWRFWIGQCINQEFECRIITCTGVSISFINPSPGACYLLLSQN